MDSQKSFKEMFGAMLEKEINVIDVPFYDSVVQIKRRLNCEEMATYVEFVASNVFASDGSYVPESMDFSNKYAAIAFYSDIAMLEDILESYSLVYSDIGLELLDVIFEYIDREQYDEIQRAISNKIAFRCDTNIAICEQKILQLTQTVNDFAEKLNDVFGDMTKEDAKNLVSSLANGFDEGKMMEAYISSKEKSGIDSGVIQDVDNGDTN